MKEDEIIVRPYHENDRESVRLICRRTAQERTPSGEPGEDEELWPILHVDYYLDYEPELCFVAETDGRVIGYVAGCKDSREYYRIMRNRIMPRVCWRILWNILTWQYRRRLTYRVLWWHMTRGWRVTLRPPLDQYPAHFHMNIEADHRGHGLAIQLFRALHKRLVEIGVCGMHGILVEEEDDDFRSATIIRRAGFKLLAVERYTLWEKMTGKKWYIKLLASEVPVKPPTQS